jgi:hypothetical protein
MEIIGILAEKFLKSRVIWAAMLRQQGGADDRVLDAPQGLARAKPFTGSPVIGAQPSISFMRSAVDMK